MFAAVVPAVANHPTVLSWDLANEPGWFAANSTYTQAAWSKHLNNTYAGNLTALSKDWERLVDPITSFDPAVDRRVAEGMGYVAMY